MCAKVMNVGGDPASDASKNLRKAFGTIFSVYRDVAIDSYYGDRASVINYPISNTSWAAPQSTDDGYKVAFSVDKDGKDIYTSDMTAEQKYAAAKTAALGFLQEAGYTISNGKAVAAPAGASLEYTALIPADGCGDHPSFMILVEAKKALADIGITLIIKDLTNSSDLWTALEAQEVAIWCAAWGASVDPDMYQIYFSGDEATGKKAGGSNYMYAINDPQLNKLILDGRASTDQAYRKGIYKSALDVVIDWAVEIPVYQRQNAIIFSAERVDLDTVTPDITTFYGWMMEIQNTTLK
ncbi:MAG: ABC transporter substrate-binding protein, partial [Ruminococcus sp.]|nr:ABC transporter substrate-binding protein [Ruminococcus sp.]